MKKARLTIEVIYNEQPKDKTIIKVLENAAEHIAEEGFIVDSFGELEVEEWTATAEVLEIDFEDEEND